MSPHRSRFCFWRRAHGPSRTLTEKVVIGDGVVQANCGGQPGSVSALRHVVESSKTSPGLTGPSSGSA